MKHRIVESAVKRATDVAGWDCVATLSTGARIHALIFDRERPGKTEAPNIAELQATLRQTPFIWTNVATGRRLARLPTFPPPDPDATPGQ